MLAQSISLAACVLAIQVAAHPTVAVEGRGAAPAEPKLLVARSPQQGMPSYDNPANHFCNNFPPAISYNAGHCVDGFTAYMDEIPNNQTCVGAGPKACQTIWSSYNAEITMCNDNPYPKCVNNSDLSYRATGLADLCGPQEIAAGWSGQVTFGDYTGIILQAAS